MTTDADLAAAVQRIAGMERVLRHYVAVCEHCDWGAWRSLGPPRPCTFCAPAREALGQRWTGEHWEMLA